MLGKRVFDVWGGDEGEEESVVGEGRKEAEELSAEGA